ncbi:MAG: hypothetical protein PUP92_36010 [Rhizonema sp. PD38]|nr:hypothetical protein [Rhizonema sp. PD38]
MRLEELSSVDAVDKIWELVNKLAEFTNVKRVRAVVPRYPDLHHIDFELELLSETELSDEAWSSIQDLVIDYEWNLRDINSEKWYFHAQVVYRLPQLHGATKVIADSENKQRVVAGRRTWSSPPLNLVVS